MDSIRRKPEVDVLIIGGGVNGCGVFRELALQGVDVLLAERGDFCSGASAASSHMIHGGLRYLENGEFRLVREALRERDRLLDNAPHYVRPLPTTVPIFRWFSGLLNAPLKFLGWLERPSERGALVVKLGLTLYDAFVSKDQAVPRHRFDFRGASLARFPRLNPEIACTATYYDAMMTSPERLCLELVLDAEAAHHSARAVNYLSVDGGEGDSVRLRDEVTGERLSVRPRLAINAAGPWIDLANGALGRGTDFVSGTKGSHLVLDHPELRQALGEHEMFFENRDGRIVLIFPLADQVLVGTSDIRIDDPDEARCTEEEVDYFLAMIGKVFPAIQVERSHIVFRFSGVRPLPASGAVAPGQISRDHKIEVVGPGDGLGFPLYCLVGGKWTTFRAFSEGAADRALAYLGFRRVRSTRDAPIGGGRDFPRTPEARRTWLSELASRTGLSEAQLEILLERYGTHARYIAEAISEADEALKHRPDFSRGEIAFLAQREKVVRLEDLVLRRTWLAKLGGLTPELLAELAEAAGEALGWSRGERTEELARTRALLAEKHGIQFEAGG